MSNLIVVRDQRNVVQHAQPASAIAGATPLFPAVILLYSTLIPMEVRLNVADQAIYPPRMAAILLLPWIIKKLAEGRLKFHFWDAIVFIGVAWMLISFMLYYDALTGFAKGGPLAFDVIAPYLIARLTIRSLTDFRRLLVYAAPGLLIAGVSMAAESFARTPIVKPLAASLFGRLANYENGVVVGSQGFVQQTRLGLMRASGPFSHPILGGAYLAAMLPLYYCSGLKGWPRAAGIIAAICGVFSLSSGAFLVFILGMGAVVADKVQRRTSLLTWPRILIAICIGLIIIEVFSAKGLTAFLIRYTLDPATGYYRQLIWQYGSASVMRHPWIGIGYTDFERLRWMGTSVDHHWLLLAMRHGLIVPLAFLSAFLTVIYLLSKKASRHVGVDRMTYIALAAVLSALVIAGLTVTYFGQMQTMFYFLFGICLSQAVRIQ